MLGMLRELEHLSIYNPLDYNMGKLDSAWEILASSRQVAGEKKVGGRGSRGRGEGGRGGEEEIGENFQLCTLCN